VPARLWEPQAFHAYERNDYNSQSLYFGMVIAMVLFNLLLFIALRDVIYLLYVSFVIFAALTLAAQNGLAHEFLWPKRHTGKYFKLYRLRAIAGYPDYFHAAHAAYVENFSKTGPVAQNFRRLAPAGCRRNIFITPGLHQPAVILNLVTAPLILGTGIMCAFKRQRSAYFFVTAFSMLIIGGVMTIFRAFA